VSAQDSNAEIFDVFLCHNTEDKPAVREIARNLVREGIKPWLDEEQIRPGTSWQTALGQQIKSIKSAAVFVGRSGLGPWQNHEIQALLSQFAKRGCPVIPVILPSAEITPELPWTLENFKYVDFRASHRDPLEQLIWGITGVRPKEYSQSSNDATTTLEADTGELLPLKQKQMIEVRLTEDLDDQERDRILSLLEIGKFRVTRAIAGNIRLLLELQQEDADRVYIAGQNGQLTALGISEVRLYPGIAASPDGEQRSQLLILLDRVNEIWIDGVLRNSLYNEVLISLGKLPIDEAVEPPWKRVVQLSRQRSQLLLHNRSIATIFNATGLLLILGEPGSGKTTALLDLAATLLSRAKADAKERVPFVLNLSSWMKKQRLDEWIAVGAVGEIWSASQNSAFMVAE
jgi:TIR domain